MANAQQPDRQARRRYRRQDEFQRLDYLVGDIRFGAQPRQRRQQIDAKRGGNKLQVRRRWAITPARSPTASLVPHSRQQTLCVSSAIVYQEVTGGGAAPVRGNERLSWSDHRPQRRTEVLSGILVLPPEHEYLLDSTTGAGTTFSPAARSDNARNT